MERAIRGSDDEKFLGPCVKEKNVMLQKRPAHLASAYRSIATAAVKMLWQADAR